MVTPVPYTPAADAVLALVSGAPALAVAILGWWLNRRDLKEQVKTLREENARLLDALSLTTTGRLRP